MSEAESTGSDSVEIYREAIESISLNDKHWWCMVIFLVEATPRHARFVRFFTEAAPFGRRKCIHSLTRKKLISDVRRLVKSDRLINPASQLICRYANDLLDSTGKLPTWLLAGLIKHAIHRAKAENVSRLRAEMDLPDDIDRELDLMQTYPGSEAGTASSKSYERRYTRVRRRGDEWKDGDFVDDGPPDGPNLFVVLTGFYDPDVVPELLRISVPVTAILKVKNPYEKITYPEDCEQDSVEGFWTSLKAYLRDPEGGERFSEIVLINIRQRPMAQFLDEEAYERLLSEIYDRVSKVVYDLFDCCWQHVRYLRSMELQCFDEKAGDPEEFRLYEEQLRGIPEELVPTARVMNALLDRVEARYKVDDFDEGEECCNKTDLDKAFEEIYDDLQFSEKQPQQPEVVVKFVKGLSDLCASHGLIVDSESYTCPLGKSEDFNRHFDTSIFESLFPEKEDWRCEHDKGVARCNCFLKTLKLYLDKNSVTFEEARHFLNLLAVEEVASQIPDQEFIKYPVNTDSICSLKKKASTGLNEDLTAIGRYYDCLLKLHKSPDLRQTCRCAVSVKCPVHWTIQELTQAEFFCRETFLGILHDCLSVYDQCRVKYVEPTDSLLLIFSNSLQDTSLMEHESSSSLRTPVCLHDFMEYVVDEETEWLANAEKKYGVAHFSNGSRHAEATFQSQDFVSPTSLKSMELKKLAANGSDGKNGATIERKASRKNSSRNIIVKNDIASQWYKVCDWGAIGFN